MKIISLIGGCAMCLCLSACEPDQAHLKHVPDFELEQLKDFPLLKSRDLKKGDFFLVNLWASWCLPCRQEHPLLLSLSKNKNIKLAGIAYRDAPLDAQRFLNQLGNPFDLIGLDQTGSAALGFGIQGVPESFVINGAGVIIFHQRGLLKKEHIAKITKMITQAHQ